MAERPTSFAQQEILAPVELKKGKLICVAKKISSGVVHEVQSFGVTVTLQVPSIPFASELVD